MPSLISKYRPGDIAKKFLGSLIKYKDTWVYVGEANDAHMLIRPSVSSNWMTVKCDEDIDNFKYDDFPMGYINEDNQTYYCERRPAKQWHVGLTSYNTTIYNIVDPNHRLGRIQDIVGTPGLTNMLNGKYPNKEQAWAAVAVPVYPEKSLGKAFSPDFAFVRKTLTSVIFYYKNEMAGEATINKYNRSAIPRITLYPSYAHILQRVKKLGLEVDLNV
jgi:hypothetical protein